jgi:hypothetical protein
MQECNYRRIKIMSKQIKEDKKKPNLGELSTYFSNRWESILGLLVDSSFKSKSDHEPLDNFKKYAMNFFLSVGILGEFLDGKCGKCFKLTVKLTRPLNHAPD